MQFYVRYDVSASIIRCLEDLHISDLLVDLSGILAVKPKILLHKVHYVGITTRFLHAYRL